MTPKKWREPKKIDIVVGKLLKKWKKTTDKKSLMMETLWIKVVGKQVAGHTRATQLLQGKLVITAENSAWMNELTFMKETIKIKAKSLFLEHDIKIDDVVFRLGNGK